MLVAVVVVAALMNLDTVARAWDAHTERAVVERVARLGGTFYTTGTDQKGPLWLSAYSVVWHLTSATTFWFGIGAAVVVVAALIAVAARSVLLRFGAQPIVATGTTLAAFTYLVLGPEEFSSELYSRNLVSCCFIVGLALALASDRWTGRGRWLALAAAGALVGLGVQTMPASGGTAVVFGAFLWWRHRREARRLHRGISAAPVVFAASATAVFVAVPLWYVARGAFHDFWQQWWTYNRIYSSATGVSLPGQLRQGASDFVGYYRDHPALAFAVGGFLATTALRWRRLDEAQRGASVLLVGWWLAECTSVSLSQRFFPHYLMLPFVPAVLMGGLFVARLLPVEIAPTARRALVPAVAVVVTLFCFTGGRFADGLAAARDFRGFSELAQQHVRHLPPDEQTVRALVAYYSEPDEYLYVWSHFPWYYTDFERASATRYIENRWLTGEIYGGNESPDNVLAGSWDKWSSDMARTQPPIVVAHVGEAIPPDSPLRRLLDERYRDVFEDTDFVVYVDAGRFAERSPDAAPSTPVVATADAGSSWTTAPGVAGWAPHPPDFVPGADVLALPTPAPCFVLDGRVEGADAPAAFPAVALDAPDDSTSLLTFRPGDATVDVAHGDTTVRLLPVDPDDGVGPPGDGRHTFEVVAGPRAALFRVDGHLVGAAPRRADGALALRPWLGIVTFRDLVIGPAPVPC